ncbi:MAG TPA: hypothetical protein VNL73_01625 [Verrucomicrobiae bacterium]|nr:hypothetical protein [Verrucomicrobiae bacterium]
MLSRFRLTQTFKGLTLFVLMSFILSVWAGCSDTKITGTDVPLVSSAPEFLGKVDTAGCEQCSAKKEVDSGTPNKIGLFLATDRGDDGTESEPAPPYLVTDGPELQLLVGMANGNPTVAAAKAYLIAGGFYYAPSVAIGVRDHYGGNEIVYLPFGVFSDPNTAAYLIYANSQGQSASAVGYVKATNTYPGNGYEYWTTFQTDDGSYKQVWVKTVSLTPIGGNTVVTDCNARYWKCFLGGALLGCRGATLRCLIMGPATLVCAATGCAFAMIPAALGCGVRTAQGCQ